LGYERSGKTGELDQKICNVKVTIIPPNISGFIFNHKRNLPNIFDIFFRW